MNQTKGYLSITGVAIIFGVFAILINYTSEMFGGYFQVFVRNFLALLVFVPFAFHRKLIKVKDVKTLRLLLLYSLIAALSFIFVSFAYLYGPVKTILVGRYVSALIFSLLISVFILKESVQTIQLWALGITAVGLVVFGFPFVGFLTLGLLFAILNSLTFNISNIIIKKVEANASTIMSFEFAAVSIITMLAIVIFKQPLLTGFSWLGIWSILLFTAGIIAVTFLIIQGFRAINFNVANIIMTSEIFFALVLSYIFLRQTVTGQEMVGISLIFVGAVLPNIQALIIGNKKVDAVE